MSRQYKKLTGIELIKSHCRVIIEHALKNDLETDGINLYISEKIAKALKLQDFLNLDGYKISIIIDNSIPEYEMENGEFSSSIQVWDPDWGTDYEN